MRLDKISLESSLRRSLDEPDAEGTNLPSMLYKGFELDAESRESPQQSHNAGKSSRAAADDLDSLLRVGQWLGSEEAVRDWTAKSKTLPTAGEEVMGFRLVRELGRGAFARVFLAEQTALADRRVVVKISHTGRDESQTLAQLQHTHIVPIYSTHVDSSSGLRILVMPYFGGTTLDRLLAKTELRADQQATGRSFVTALDGLTTMDFDHHRGGSSLGTNSQNWGTSTASRLPSLGVSQSSSPRLASRFFGRAFLGSWRDSASPGRTIGQPARHILERSSYIQAVTWIAARLAEGIAHAHHRGILHRDIKPSNVLIASDGQPMLLDFNLAHDMKSNDSGAVAYVGGTLPFMAPEHLDAFNVANPTPPTAVDERSDIYSLGIVIFEMLTNRNPFSLLTHAESLPATLDRMANERRCGAPSTRKLNPAVPKSLDAVVRRCLEPDPNRRYPEAAHLAEDLQCELDHLPLAHTPEPSVAERTRKWMRRHPRLSSAGSIAAIGGMGITGLIVLVLAAGGRLAGYDAERRWLKFQEGLVRAQLLIHTGLESGQNLAEGERVCKHTLALFDVLGDTDWLHRSRVERLSKDQRAKLPKDVTELMILLARDRAEQGRLTKSVKVQNALLTNAVRLLDYAEQTQKIGLPRALYEDRGNYRRALGDIEGAERDAALAQNTPMRTARDHYLRAMSLAIEKRYHDATSELLTASRMDPKHFWSHFELGICYYQTGQFNDAAGAYDVCVALWNEFPWTFLNRGLVRSRQGRFEDAIADYTDAIRFDRDFAEAYLNRGLAYLNQHSYTEAIADLTHAINSGQRKATTWAARAVAYAGEEHFDAARKDFEEAFLASPGDESVLLSRGFALARNEPEQALADFDRILGRNPQSAQASYGRAYALSELPGQNLEAIESARQALAADSGLLPARCLLAVLLARQSDFTGAVNLVEEALRSSPSGPVCYAAACVYALASREDNLHAEKSLKLLQEALEQNYGWNDLSSDADLERIRQQPEFAKILASQK